MKKRLLVMIMASISPLHGQVEQLASAFNAIIQTQPPRMTVQELDDALNKAEDPKDLEILFVPNTKDLLLQWIEQKPLEELKQILSIKDIFGRKNYLVIAFKKNMIDIARALWKSFPGIFEQKLETQNGSYRLLFSLLQQIESLTENQGDFLLDIIKSLSEDALKTQMNKSPKSSTLGELVMNNKLGAVPLCDAMLDKVPSLVSGNLLNSSIENYVQRFAALCQTEKGLSVPSINAQDFHNLRDIILCLIRKGDYKLEKANNRENFKIIFDDMIVQYVRYGFDIFKHCTNHRLYQDFIDGYFAIYKAFIEKEPELLEDLSEQQEAMNDYKKNHSERYKALEPFFEYALGVKDQSKTKK